MKRFLALLTAFAAIVCTCFTAMAENVEKSYDLSGFTGIEAGNLFNITLEKAPSWSVDVEIAEEFEPYLEVKVNRGTLYINLKNVPRKLSMLKNIDMKARVCMPEVSSITLSGGARLICDDKFDLGNKDLNISLGGASEIKKLEILARNANISLSGTSRASIDGGYISTSINNSGTSRLVLGAGSEDLVIKSSGTAVGELEGSYEDVKISLSGAANVTLTGEAEELDVEASGASSVDALKMPVSKAFVHLSGAGVCKTYVLKELEAECTGASTCSYKCDGKIDLEVKQIARSATLKKL